MASNDAHDPESVDSATADKSTNTAQPMGAETHKAESGDTGKDKGETHKAQRRSDQPQRDRDVLELKKAMMEMLEGIMKAADLDGQDKQQFKEFLDGISHAVKERFSAEGAEIYDHLTQCLNRPGSSLRQDLAEFQQHHGFLYNQGSPSSSTSQRPALPPPPQQDQDSIDGAQAHPDSVCHSESPSLPIEDSFGPPLQPVLSLAYRRSSGYLRLQ